MNVPIHWPGRREGPIFNPADYLQNLFFAAAGLAVMLGVPMLASKVKGGLPLMFIGLAGLALYLEHNGYISL
jgi:hypothetical protein